MSQPLSEAQDAFFAAFAQLSAQDRRTFAFMSSEAAPNGNALEALARAESIVLASQALQNLSDAIKADPA